MGLKSARENRDPNTPRWLSDEEMLTWRKLMAIVMDVGPGVESDVQKYGGLSLFEYQVLSALAESGGTLPMTRLGERCSCSLSRLSHAGRKLEARELLIRSQALNDGRVTIAELTLKGREIVEAASAKYHNSIRRHFLDALSDEQLEAADILADHLLYYLEPDHWLFEGQQQGEDNTESNAEDKNSAEHSES